MFSLRTRCAMVKCGITRAVARLPLREENPMSVSHAIAAVFSLIAATGIAGHAFAQPAGTYPTKPIRFIVPFAPGGPSDMMARLVAPGLTDALGQPLHIDNRGGANGMVGTEVAARTASTRVSSGRYRTTRSRTSRPLRASALPRSCWSRIRRCPRAR
jgi:hypothetical protein